MAATLTTLFDLDVERQALALLVLSPTLMDDLPLKPDHFHAVGHRALFAAMRQLGPQPRPIDHASLYAALKQQGQHDQVGGSAGLWEIIGAVAVPDEAAARRHAETIKELADLRFLQGLLRQTLDGVGRQQATHHIVQQVSEGLAKLEEGEGSRSWVSIGEAMLEAMELIDAAYHGQHNPAAIIPQLGLPYFDQRRPLLGKGHLVVMAARPGMGKTSLAFLAALHAAQAGKTVGMVSLEMTKEELAKRAMVMRQDGLTLKALDQGTLTEAGWAALAEVGSSITPLSLYIHDPGNSTIDQIERKAKYLKAIHGLDLLIIDYLQLLTMPKAENRNVAVSEVSRRAKGLAMSLKIPVILLSQLSRECERRENKRPVLSDLRDSGAIEQDADVVLMIYRDEVYNSETDTPGTAELLVRKHRHGPTGHEAVKWIGHRTLFEDL